MKRGFRNMLWIINQNHKFHSRKDGLKSNDNLFLILAFMAQLQVVSDITFWIIESPNPVAGRIFARSQLTTYNHCSREELAYRNRPSLFMFADKTFGQIFVNTQNHEIWLFERQKMHIMHMMMKHKYAGFQNYLEISTYFEYNPRK